MEEPSTQNTPSASPNHDSAHKSRIYLGIGFFYTVRIIYVDSYRVKPPKTTLHPDCIATVESYQT